MIKGRKKGYLLIELVMYIALVGILLVFAMDLSIFMAKQYKSTAKEMEFTTRWIELDTVIDSIIETASSVEVVGSLIKVTKNDKVNILEKNYAGLVYGVAGNRKTIAAEVSELDIKENGKVLYLTFTFECGNKRVGVYGK